MFDLYPLCSGKCKKRTSCFHNFLHAVKGSELLISFQHLNKQSELSKDHKQTTNNRKNGIENYSMGIEMQTHQIEKLHSHFLLFQEILQNKDTSCDQI